MTQHADPDLFFAKSSFKAPKYVAELLSLFRPLIDQYRAAGMGTRYVDILDDDYEALRLRCVKIVTANDATFRATARFPSRGCVTRADGRQDFVLLSTIERRTRFLLHEVSGYLRSLKPRPGQHPPPPELVEGVSSLVISLRRVLGDPDSSQ